MDVTGVASIDIWTCSDLNSIRGLKLRNECLRKRHRCPSDSSGLPFSNGRYTVMDLSSLQHLEICSGYERTFRSSRLISFGKCQDLLALNQIITVSRLRSLVFIYEQKATPLISG